jgi:hypothetical protein
VLGFDMIIVFVVVVVVVVIIISELWVRHVVKPKKTWV